MTNNSVVSHARIADITAQKLVLANATSQHSSASAKLGEVDLTVSRVEGTLNPKALGCKPGNPWYQHQMRWFSMLLVLQLLQFQ